MSKKLGPYSTKGKTPIGVLCSNLFNHLSFALPNMTQNFATYPLDNLIGSTTVFCTNVR